MPRSSTDSVFKSRKGKRGRKPETVLLGLPMELDCTELGKKKSQLYGTLTRSLDVFCMAVVKVSCKNLKNNPRCPHGPTLKFVRVRNGLEQSFFACSTYRDRKDCGFYLIEGEELTEEAQSVWDLEREKVLPSVDHVAAQARLKEVKQAVAKDRLYCHTCCQLDLVSRREHHASHNTRTHISDTLLACPSQIIKPKERSKKEAQYLFSASTTKLIVDNLRGAGVSRVLCLGTPRLHEHIQAVDSDIDSLLLDLDPRYHSFWSPEKFIWYNMFNRHFLSASKDLSRRTLKSFLSASDRMALVMDPPFGGHVEPLATTICHFIKMVAKSGQDKQLLVFWVFPYFRERHIVEKCPDLVMLDYKVEYDNHKEFNNGSKGRKLGSPVRLFTNMEPKRFVLPKDAGYRLCSICARWVSAENKHCAKCNVCPSKDGRTYIHCDLCGSCVKPQWKHCVTCHKCLPSSHDCTSKAEQSLYDENMEPRHKRIKMIRLETKHYSLKKNKSKRKKNKISF